MTDLAPPPLILPPSLWMPKRPAILRAHEPVAPLVHGILPGMVPVVVQQGPLPTLVHRRAAGSSSDASTYNFTSTNFGDPAATRIIIVAAAAKRNNTSSFTMSCTIGGITATRADSVHIGSGAYSTRLSIFYAAVPTGTSGTVSISTSATVVSCGCDVFSLHNAMSGTPIDKNVASSLTNDATPLDVSLASLIYGAAIVGTACASSPGGTSFTWSGLTEDSDRSVDSGNDEFTLSAASFSPANSGTRTITATTGAANARKQAVSAAWR